LAKPHFADLAEFMKKYKYTDIKNPLMEKKGQIGGVIRYFLIAVVIIVISFSGYSAYATLQEKACNAELVLFESELRELDEKVTSGSVKEFTKHIPCNADEVYFFDKSKDFDLSLYEINPFLKENVESKVEDNVFLVRKNKILASFNAGNLEIEYPNYVCMIPKFEKVNFFLEGKGKAALLFSGCFQPECTYIPSTIEDIDAIEAIDEAVEFGANDPSCTNCPASTPPEFIDFLKTEPNILIFRKFEFCKADNKTNVEILIKPKGKAKLKNLRLYESIPKECIDDLNEYLASYSDFGEVSIKFDPLILWSLGDVKDEKTVSYALNTILNEECRKAIEGMGIAEIIEDGVAVNIPVCSNADSSCGPVIPFCQNCNSLDAVSVNYCNLNNVANDIHDYSCVANECKLSVTAQVVESCSANNGVCPPGTTDCSCQNNDNSCGTYPSCLDCTTSGQICDSGNCVNPPPVCPNGILETGELCDDPQYGGQTCASQGFDGGILSCFNSGPGQCNFDFSACYKCGDGVVNPGEQCDLFDFNGKNCASLGLIDGSLSCTAACQLDTSNCITPSVCGNGNIETGEQCDDGNINPGEGCDAACQIESGWTCSGEPSVCSLIVLCGNNNIDPTEECDGNSNLNSESCSSLGLGSGTLLCSGTCQFDTSSCNPLAVCGNGIKEPPEQCDDGNTNNNDECSSTCKLEVCGDGIIQNGIGEQCEGSNLNGKTCLEIPYSGSNNFDGGDLKCNAVTCKYDTSLCFECGVNGVSCEQSCGEYNTIGPQCFFSGSCGKNCRDNNLGDWGREISGCGFFKRCECYWEYDSSCSLNPSCDNTPNDRDGQDVPLLVQCGCADECSSGATICSGTGYQTCGNFDADSCLEWGSVQSCAPGTCTSGQCACLNTNTNCGAFPSCSNCNSQNGFVGGNYCQGNNVVRDFSHYSCSSNSCQASTSAQVIQTCSGGQICQGGGCVNAVASFSASYSNLQKNSGSRPPGVPIGANWWYFDVTLIENTGNVGIMVEERQTCYTSNNPIFPSWCDSVKTDITTWYGTNYITPGNQINGNNQWIWFENDGFTYTLTETLKGLDDNGNNMQASYVITVTSN
jgi:cysteine-rich repeat protein